MAGVMGAEARAQYGALAQMRWRMLVNSLRSRRGKFELSANLFSTGFFLLIWLGAGAGLGFAAWHFVTENQVAMLAILLWPVLVMWQAIPVMLVSYQGNVDLSILLRFPVSFGSYALLYIVFGLFDLSSVFGGTALLGIWIGTVLARPGLAFWAAIALICFALFNLLLTRMIFAWVDRWLAQRKTREILGTLILFLFLGLQFLNPAFHQRHGHSSSFAIAVKRRERLANRLQRPLPPALAARAIQLASQGHGFRAAVPLGGMALYAIAAAALLVLRLRAEYRGESLADAPVAVAKTREIRAISAGGSRPSVRGSGTIGAIVEKELRYLSRSGTMLYGLLAPLVLLFLFGGASRSGSAFQYAFPLGVAYGFLGLTRLVGNSLGGEGAGIQIYFFSPTRFRTVMLGKNLVQLLLFGLELVMVCVIVRLRFGMPRPLIIVSTFCWLSFALPLQLAIGNVLSITMAYRMTLTRMSRQQGATGNGMLTLLFQILLFGVGAAIFLSLRYSGNANLAPLVFLVMGAGAVAVWLWGLSAVDRMAASRRDVLIAALTRGS